MSKSAVPATSSNPLIGSLRPEALCADARFAAMFCFLANSGAELVQPVRIIDQDAALSRAVRRVSRDEVDEVAVVRHVPRNIRVRPVRAPEDPVRGRLD